ncbi:MAG: hypothetical protein AAGA83_00895 [Cyanobacteria bacterium P01_F01_bin.116]
MVSSPEQTDSSSSLDSALTIPREFISNNAIQPRVIELWETLSAKNTLDVFENALQSIWQVLKVLWRIIVQLIAIFSLLFLFFAAIIVWFWGIGFQAGRAFNSVTLDASQSAERQVVNALARIFLFPIWALSTWVKKQFKEKFDKDIEFPLPDMTFQLWKPPDLE